MITQHMMPTIFPQTEQTKVRNDTRGADPTGTGGIQHGTTIGTDPVGKKQHASPDQLQEQQKAACQSQGLRQTLQHGTGECERDVDGNTKIWKRQKEGETGKQGQIYCQDVP